MECKKIDDNGKEPRKMSLLQKIVSIGAGVMDDHSTSTTNDTDTPRPTRKRTPGRTTHKVRTEKYYTDRQYKDWARMYDPDQQCKQYNRKRGLL